MFMFFRFMVIFLLMSFSGRGQSVTFNMSIGGGTYALNDLKTFQKEIKDQFVVEATITEKFPPYLFYEGSCHVALSDAFFVGVSFAYGSTGGRVQYRDYSGYLLADQDLRYMNFSIPAGYVFKVKENLTLSFDLKPTYTVSRVDLLFEQEIQGQHDASKLQFKSKSIAIQPGVLIMRKFGRFGLHAQASYYLSVWKDKLYYMENDDFHLLNDSNEPVNVEWDGVRLSLGASIFIGKSITTQ